MAEPSPAAPLKNALHSAVKSRDHDQLTRLLHAGICDVNSFDIEGNTPLHLAARKFYPHCARTLLFWRADANAKNADGATPFDVVALDVEDTTVLGKKPNRAKRDFKTLMRSGPEIRREGDWARRFWLVQLRLSKDKKGAQKGEKGRDPFCSVVEKVVALPDALFRYTVKYL